MAYNKTRVMKDRQNISGKMVRRASAVLVLTVALVGTACEQEEAMPKRNAGYDKEYVLPQARILTQQERDLIRARREEYNQILKD